ncbi:heme-binding protein [Flammeovirgaceae bacterium SG7u.111]|nr:heme-binding protein [Flammeovirgaceae bacterium SG7u.132]WPO34262.1 heme-binding protein [Flammeovirgaceae bacterium SG7u.111]
MKKLIFLLLTFIVAQVAIAQQKPFLSLDAAKKMGTLAEEKSEAAGYKMNIAIVDDGGQLVYFVRMDGAKLSGLDIAIKKAVCAAYYEASTESYQKRIADGTLQLIGMPHMLPFEGGVPLKVGDTVVGAIGVSGATAAQDGDIADLAVALFEELTKD